jgi:hypothetical protein
MAGAVPAAPKLRAIITYGYFNMTIFAACLSLTGCRRVYRMQWKEVAVVRDTVRPVALYSFSGVTHHLREGVRTNKV